ncbi:NAD(P)-dependent dehydrogenase (short-subunit alcohol dehydrogenase family) [Aminobacter lissarensis]|uniref:NAD(P)-dependent dehydrogenase (Short-subunit alcohol dehydrogenase family) n=1 Tax=Aminobacter carboxidus TaxID=376165 RepID=A0A8E1WKQ8_9HYPH|nr:SDR family oxidoreductase [Aminobacter lissarensis]MBB6470328.1 NAD(P)-dependent dehydrogenase (short-subunit alcohol dehydrogenase family) [Aminobacter lissarensis]
MNIRESVVIVTGSATGVGAACVRKFAERGARVAVNYNRSKAEAEETADTCRALGAEVIVLQGDVADDGACRAMVGAVVERWGRLDALVNNAAMTVKSNPFDLETLSASDFQDVFAVNVVGAYQMCRAAIPTMRTSGGGAIVNVSSNVAFTGGGSSLAYTASKGALNALTMALARTCGPDIRVNAVCPGVIDTRWMRQTLGTDSYAALAKRYSETAPLGRVATPEDVAGAVVWLIEGADFVTGELLSVDGGVRLAGGVRRQALGTGDGS